MNHDELLNRLETLELKLKGVSSALQLISEANAAQGNELNTNAIQLIAETIDSISNEYLQTTIELLFKGNSEGTIWRKKKHKKDLMKLQSI